MVFDQVQLDKTVSGQVQIDKTVSDQVQLDQTVSDHLTHIHNILTINRYAM